MLAASFGAAHPTRPHQTRSRMALVSNEETRGETYSTIGNSVVTVVCLVVCDRQENTGRPWPVRFPGYRSNAPQAQQRMSIDSWFEP